MQTSRRRLSALAVALPTSTVTHMEARCGRPTDLCALFGGWPVQTVLGAAFLFVFRGWNEKGRIRRELPASWHYARVTPRYEEINPSEEAKTI